MINLEDIKISIEPGGEDLDTLPPNWQHNTWTITLTYKNKNMQFPFYTGLDISYPTKEEILTSILEDGKAYANAKTYRKFCNEFDFAQNYLINYKLYLGCKKVYSNLLDLFGEEKLQSLFDNVF